MSGPSEKEVETDGPYTSVERVESAGPPYKFAGFSGPHPTLVVACPTCGSPEGHYCNDADKRPVDRPHHERCVAAGTAKS